MKIFGKKWLSMSVAAVAAVCAIGLISGLVACGDEGTPSQHSSYDITAPASSDVYTVDGLPESAVTGEQVSFKVTLTEPEDSALHSVVVEPVFDASFVVEPSADGTYAFTMPDGPVKIIVDAEK